MPSRMFIVKSDPVGNGWDVWFRVYLYDTDAELQRAAKRYSIYKEINWDGCQGCFHPRTVFGVDRHGHYYHSKNSKYIGVMRLSRESITKNNVIHECAHAAINYVSVLTLKNGYMVGRSNLHSEEALCYAVGEFSTAILNHLKDVVPQ